MAIYGDGKHNENTEHVHKAEFSAYVDELSATELDGIKSFADEFYALLRKHRSVVNHIPSALINELDELLLETNAELKRRLTDEL